MTTGPLTVLFLPESAFGPTNNCIGIGDVLRRRGHRVVFAAEASWKGKLEALGFEEDLVDLAPAPEAAEAAEAADADPGAFWKEFIRETAPQFRRPTVEQLETVIKPIWQGLIDGVKHSHPQLTEIVARSGADVVVEDNVATFPALLTAGVPFVRIVSCNPLEVTGPGVPPAFSGLPSDDHSGWDAFRAENDRVHRELWTAFDAWSQAQGAPPLGELEFMHASDVLNLYVYPEALDYTGSRPLDATWHRLDSSVRRTEAAFELPEHLRAGSAAGGSALIYLSLGSLGSADVELMRRLVASLAATPHRYVVSKGPLHAEFELADNMWGAEFVPQTSVLPLVDLVITHGGNNTTTEAIHFGKPMVVLPLFWDQYDNAQRVHETGFGIRLDTYGWTDADLHGAIEALLADTALRDRLAAVGAQVRERDGVTLAADLIEDAAQRHRAAQT